MSEQLIFIPASEAASLSGVTKETIRNLCKAGTLRYQMRGNMFYPCKEDVERYTAAISEVHEIERSIEDYKREISKAYEQLRNAKQEMQDRLDNMEMFPERIKNITDLLMSLIPHFEGNLTDREVEIMVLVLQGDKISDVAQKQKLTRDRTRQIWEKTIRKMSYYPSELSKKDEQIEDLKKTIQDLETILDQAGIDKVPHSKSKLLASSIYDYDFSVRTMNCLKAAEVETVRDLVKINRESLLKFRGFGKTSLEELDKFLADHNLSWGMEID